MAGRKAPRTVERGSLTSRDARQEWYIGEWCSAQRIKINMIAGGNHSSSDRIWRAVCEAMPCAERDTQRFPCCGTRYLPRLSQAFVSYRPLPLALLASSAAGSARIAPPMPLSLVTFLCGYKKVTPLDYKNAPTFWFVFLTEKSAGCITGRSSDLPVLRSGYGQLPDVASGGQPDALLASDRSKKSNFQPHQRLPCVKGAVTRTA